MRHILREREPAHEVPEVVRQHEQGERVLAFLYPLLAVAAPVVEMDHGFRRRGHVGDYEAHAGEQLSRVPLHLGYHPSKPVP